MGQENADIPDLLPGTLDLLILKALVAGREQLIVERQEFDRLILAIRKVLNAT